METGIEKHLNGNRSLRDEIAMPDIDDANDISAALYKEAINSKNIEKLGSKMAVFSIAIPLMLVAIMVYGYLDIKDRVMTIQNSGQTQVDVLVMEFESKINAIDVEIAKIKLALEKDIPELKQQTIAIQDELTLIAETKSNKEETQKTLELLKTNVDKVLDQYQGALHILDRTNQETLDIVNEKAKEIEATVKADVESVKIMQADIDSKISSIKNIESDIDTKIDAKVVSVVDKIGDRAVDKKVQTAINEKLAAHKATVEKKVADIDLAVESKLATLQEVTQIVAESKTSITKLQTNIDSLSDSVGIIDKELKDYQAKTDSNKSELGDKQKFDTDKKYIDSQIATLKKNLNGRIDQLDLNLSKKLLQYSVKLETLIQSQGKNSDSKKKTERTQFLLNKPERGKISETDLIQ